MSVPFLRLVYALSAADTEVMHRLERERELAVAALELAGTAVAAWDPRACELRLNGSARRLVADIPDGETQLRDLILRSGTGTASTRSVDVRLATGDTATLLAHVTDVPGDDSAFVCVLELQREPAAIPPCLLAPLTPREREVAALVVEGLADREIAERLSLSRHTVGQHVKRVYRKLGVDSRVALTRLLLASPSHARRG